MLLICILCVQQMGLPFVQRKKANDLNDLDTVCKIISLDRS